MSRESKTYSCRLSVIRWLRHRAEAILNRSGNRGTLRQIELRHFLAHYDVYLALFSSKLTRYFLS